MGLAEVDLVEVKISLPPKVADLLSKLAEIQDLSQDDAVQKAILSDWFLLKEILNDSEILVLKKGGQLEKVVFPEWT